MVLWYTRWATSRGNERANVVLPFTQHLCPGATPPTDRSRIRTQKQQTPPACFCVSNSCGNSHSWEYIYGYRTVKWKRMDSYNSQLFGRGPALVSEGQIYTYMRGASVIPSVDNFRFPSFLWANWAETWLGGGGTP